jgi:hypothetical protein
MFNAVAIFENVFNTRLVESMGVEPGRQGLKDLEGKVCSVLESAW